MEKSGNSPLKLSSEWYLRKNEICDLLSFFLRVFLKGGTTEFPGFLFHLFGATFFMVYMAIRIMKAIVFGIQCRRIYLIVILLDNVRVYTINI